MHEALGLPDRSVLYYHFDASRPEQCCKPQISDFYYYYFYYYYCFYYYYNYNGYNYYFYFYYYYYYNYFQASGLAV